MPAANYTKTGQQTKAQSLSVTLASDQGALTQGHAKGTRAFTTAAPTASAVLLLAANTARIAALLVNNGTQTVYLGRANTVTTANGVPLAPGAALTDEVSTGDWYGITASGTGDIRVVEVA